MCFDCKRANPEPKKCPFDNEISIELSDTKAPRLVINGVDIAPSITKDWTLTRKGDGSGDALLTVSFPVFLP